MIPNDHWTLGIGDLGMEDAGQRLARLVLQCEPPFAICVQGKWGSGKTSLMRYAMAALGGEPLAMTLKTTKKSTAELPSSIRRLWNQRVGESQELIRETLFPKMGDAWQEHYEQKVQVVPIWFNPWQHQQAELPLVALLQELRAQFSHLTKLGRMAKKLSAIGVEAGLSLVGELIDLYASAQGAPKLGAGKALSQVRGAGEAYEHRNFEGLENAQRLNLLFEEAVSRLLRPSETTRAATISGEKELRRLVIFIDDLDRCTDAQTVKLLEAIKLYLQTPYCVFVVGMDGAAARRAVERVLPNTRPEEAQEYLEKLFQARIYVPVPRAHEGFVKKLLVNCQLNKALTGMAPAEVAQIVTRLVEPNPRKLKTFVSTLAIAWQVIHPPGEAQSRMKFRDFLLVAYLRAYHPRIFRLLAHTPELAVDLYQVLVEFAEQPQPEPSPVHRLFHRSFRHAYDRTPDDEAEAAVEELVERLDRWRGDRAFLELWRESFQEPEEIPARLALALGVSCGDA